jgi:hypothetical protein
MGISVYWQDHQHTVLCQSFVGTWDWDEYNASIDLMYSMIKQVTHTVHLVADVRYTAPQGHGPAWKPFSRALRRLPANTGLIITCGKGYFVTVFFLQLARTFPQLAPRVKQVFTMEEVDALIGAYVPPVRPSRMVRHASLDW